MARYRVHLTGKRSITIEARAIDPGTNWLWFFDDQDRLIGQFRWQNILGVSVEGSAAGQVIAPHLVTRLRSTTEPR